MKLVKKLKQIPFTIRITALGLLCVELLSLLGWRFPAINLVGFTLIVLLTLYLSLKDLKFGLAVLLIELIIGSQGYLFSLQVAGISISVRLAIFLIIFFCALYQVVQEQELQFCHSRFFWPLTVLLGFIAFAVVRGYFLGNSLSILFFDTNGYLFFGAALPLWQAIRSDKDLQWLWAPLTTALIASTIKIFFLEYVFSHSIWWTLPEVYKWVRDTRVGEIVRYVDPLYRVFFQSQIITLPAFFILTLIVTTIAIKKERVRDVFRDKRWWAGILFLSAIFSSILISLSRSNWVGLALAAIVLLIVVIASFNKSFKWLSLAGLNGLIVLVFSLTMILSTIFFPFPAQNAAFSGVNLISKRFEQGAAVSSRYQLYPPLRDAIQAAPILGAGLGKTVTYISNDPRIREETPSGEVTTFAFEWGWLDLWLKLGLFGAIAYLGLILFLCKQSSAVLKNRLANPTSSDLMHLGIALGGVAIVATHFFSPYLNHPLGVAYLLFWGLMVDRAGSASE